MEERVFIDELAKPNEQTLKAAFRMFTIIIIT